MFVYVFSCIKIHAIRYPKGVCINSQTLTCTLCHYVLHWSWMVIHNIILPIIAASRALRRTSLALRQATRWDR